MSQIIIVVEVKERNQVLNRGNHFVFNSFENKTFRNEYKWGWIRISGITVQNWMPRTLLPSLSSGGDQHMMPITLGTTSRIPPATPDLAGSPTWKTQKANQYSIITSLLENGAAKAGTDMEGELAGEVVHAAGVHQAQSVSHSLRAQHAIAGDGAEAAVGQSRRHYTSALAGHLNGAQLMRKTQSFDLVDAKERQNLEKWQTAAIKREEANKRCCLIYFLLTWK